MKASVLMVGLVGVVGLAGQGLAAVLLVHNTGEGLAQGDPDPHWSVTLPDGTAFGPAISATDPNGGWITPSGPNTWISTVPRAGIPSGVYRYTTTFTIGPGFDPATAEVSGNWWSDEPNAPNAILLNGVQVSDFDGAVWFDTDASHALFNITSGFASGLNELTFLVENTAGPGGMLIENLTGIVAVPETVSVGSAALLCAAFGGYRCWLRRRRTH